MGYYIYHDKFTLEKSDDGYGLELNADAYTKSDLVLFEKYFQNVKTIDYVDSIIICNSYAEVNNEKIRFNYNKGIFHKDDINLINKYISHKKYDTLIRKEEILYDRRKIIEFYNTKIVYGYYSINIFEHTFNDVHYKFREKYKAGETYSKLEDFKEACNLEYDQYRFEKSEFEDRVSLFKENLIDKYEFGKSTFCFI